MTNEEKYKTPEERKEAFLEFCTQKKCDKCECSKQEKKDILLCEFMWLTLESEEEKPLTCPFCGSVDIKVMSSVRPDYVVSSCYVVSCCNCGAVSRAEATKTDAIAAWNRRAK